MAFAISQLQRRTNLIGVEVVDPLLLPFRLVNPRQRRIATRLIEIQNAPPRRLLTQHPQPLPEEMLLLRRAFDFSGFGNPPPQAVIAISARTFQLAVDQRFGTHQPVLTVIGKTLKLAIPRALLDQVAPRVVAILLFSPAVDTVDLV
ncbi:hypothetical protein BLX42_20195 [Pseudomonas sp. SG-MS2]|nr:hypothetical protein BLX42_20195 [Pseudomonas sp. SG-MS2]